MELSLGVLTKSFILNQSPDTLTWDSSTAKRVLLHVEVYRFGLGPLTMELPSLTAAQPGTQCFVILSRPSCVFDGPDAGILGSACSAAGWWWTLLALPGYLPGCKPET